MLNVYAYCYDYLLHKTVPDWIADGMAKKIVSRDGYTLDTALDELLDTCADVWHMEKTSAALDIVSERLV